MYNVAVALAADMSFMAVVLALLPPALWLLAAGLRRGSGNPDRRPPPLLAGSAMRTDWPTPQPHGAGQDPLGHALTEALAPARLAMYARGVPPRECLALLHMAEGSDRLSGWMRLSCYEAQEDVTRLLRAWVTKARPEPRGLASFSRAVITGLDWQRHCTLRELLLLSDVAATVAHLVRSGGPLYGSIDELAQVSHLLARWHMPDHLQTRRGSTTWLQWMAVVVPALWLTLLWAMQLRGGVRRRRRAQRGVRFLHPLVQMALAQGKEAPPSAGEALAEFLARQCLLVVAPPPKKPACTSSRVAWMCMSASPPRPERPPAQRPLGLRVATGST